MNSSSAPATPSTPAPLAQTIISDAPTGTWKHPRYAEIIRRRNAANFGEKNIRTVALNGVIFFLTFFASSLSRLHPLIEGFTNSIAPLPSYVLLVSRVVPILFIIAACLPLLKPEDDLSDIPLTPTQRALLGLGPASRPATPGSQYITPPKYSRSSTPASRASSARSESSLGGSRGSPFGTTAYSPSPLFQKAINRDATRRLSYGSPSSMMQPKLLANESVLSTNSFASPSPTARSPESGLSSRWVYEKMRDTQSPKRRSLYA